MSVRGLAILSSIAPAAATAIAVLFSPAAQAITTYQFNWEGQIAGFRVEGVFSYDETAPIADGIVRKDNLLSFDVSFIDPTGNLLRTYEDNHLTYELFNFNFDTNTLEILQDGLYFEPDGIDIGEYTPDGEGGFTGLNLWSIPREDVPPHLHFDDWGNEFDFPRAFGGHEDIGWFTVTTQGLIDTGNVGEAYVDNPNFGLDEFGQRVTVAPIPVPPAIVLLASALGFASSMVYRRRKAQA